MRRRNTYIEGLQPNAPIPFKRDAERMAAQFESDAYVVDGVVRWKSNDNVPPGDILEFWDYIHKEFNLEKSLHAQTVDNEVFLEKYREQRGNQEPSLETLFEMRAAFGEGTEVVNVITGKRTKL